MDLFKWRDNFNIGIEAIDQQHQAFLRLLNDCYETVRSVRNAEIDPVLLDKLKSYATTHFRFEEVMMQDRGYPEIERQKRQHAYFESQIAAFEKPAAGAARPTAEKFMSVLRDWFVNHVLGEDMDFAAYIK